MLLALTLASCAFVLPPPRAHVLPRRLAAGPRPAAAVARVIVASSPGPNDAQPPARSGAGGASVVLEGQTISGGSDVLVADEHGSWWTAVVVDVRRASGDVDILVHYRGCDPAWDEWLAADSGRVIPQPKTLENMSAGDETWRDVDDGLDPVTDADLLAKLRAERQAIVDQWQYNTLCAVHEGTWVGTVTRYESRSEMGEPLRLQADQGSAISAAMRADGDLASSRTITVSECAPADPQSARAALARPPLVLQPAELRAARGHMAVGGAYTLTHSPSGALSALPPDEQPLLIEIALAHPSDRASISGSASPGAAAGSVGTAAAGAGPERKQRVRCTLSYSPFVASAQADGGGSAQRARRIEWVEIARETSLLPGAPAPGAGSDGAGGDAGLPQWASALRGEAGTGLYDPEAQRVASGLYSLYCAGGLTVVLPTQLLAGVPAALSVDWDTGEMRYQADRKSSGEHDGSLLTLELTEAMGSDDPDAA